MSIRENIQLSKDILRGLNQTLWGGVEGVEKTNKIVKNGLTAADSIIGVSHTLEDLACNDYTCAAFDAVGSASSGLGLILGNIERTKGLTVYTGSITICCRAVRFYCKKYGTFGGCTVATAEGVRHTVKLALKR